MNIFKRMYLNSKRVFSLRREVGAIIKDYPKYFHNTGCDLNKELIYTYHISGKPVDRLKELVLNFSRNEVMDELSYWRFKLGIESIILNRNTIIIEKKGKG